MKNTIKSIAPLAALLFIGCAQTKPIPPSLTEDAAKKAAMQAVTDAVKAATQTAEPVTIAPLDAAAAAQQLGTTCQKYKRADQCVIAFFDKKSPYVIESSKNAVYYRVLYGMSGNVIIGQDFYTSGQKQTNVYFAKSSKGILNSFNNSDQNFEGKVNGYKANGQMYFSIIYRNGKAISSKALAH